MSLRSRGAGLSRLPRAPRASDCIGCFLLLTAERADGQVCKRIFPEGCVEGENKGYSRDYEAQWPPMRGRIRVRLFDADGKPTNPDITTRKQLFLKVAELIPRMPSRQAGYVDPQQVRRHAPKPAAATRPNPPARRHTDRAARALSLRRVSQSARALSLRRVSQSGTRLLYPLRITVALLPMPVHRLALARFPPARAQSQHGWKRGIRG